MLSYQLATIEDLSFIVEVYNSIISTRMVTADTENVTVEQREHWFYKHDNLHPIWIVKDFENLIGWVSVQPFHPRKAYEKSVEISIYLSVDSRGKGYGREVLKWTIEELKKMNYKNIIALIFAHNLPSIQLFEKEGFETWGFLPAVANFEKVEVDLKILGKKIR